MAAFGTESWQAFFHWMPRFSQAFFTQGRATFYKMQSVFGLVRTIGGSEPLAWTFQLTMSGTVAVSLVLMWHSHALRAQGRSTCHRHAAADAICFSTT
jgi:hypothetical protein